ncbi:MAG: AAA domain-containing protein, partial [Acidimicrobiia bacterium]|nr:AAA domain-containing protein [Acidimicrobiia bacterium]
LATDTVPEASHCLGALAAETALARPTSIAEWEDATALVAEVESTLHNYDVGIFDADLDALAGALAPASEGLVARGAASVFNGRYRRARKAAWKLARVDREPAELLVDVGRARDQRSKWAHRAVDRGLPRIPPSFEPARTALDRLTSQLDALTEWTGDDQRDRSHDEARTTARELVDDRTTLFRLPRLHEIRADLDHHGLSAALDEAGDRRLGAEDAGALIRSIWLQSMLDLVGLSDPDIGTFDGTAHTDLVAEFGNHDRGHIGDGARRVMRRAAERAVATLNAHPEQAQLVRQQAGRRRGHLPLRELLSRAPDVLIAVKPCWAMSPLVVSQLLPNDPPLFDFVIFDEASQIPPAEAVPAILRGRQLVVAGDSRQLPPTTFFSTSVEPQDDPDDDGPEDDAGTELVTEDMESILDAMTTMLPPPHGSKTLDWHYRSRDERLIAFSNAQPSLYDSTMTTFPGVGIDKPIQHVHVPWAPVVAGKDQSVEDEVQAVVDLVVQHARDSPDATLGVIAMGIVHADRIAETLRLERKTDPTLDAFLAAHPDEPFFVKNLERVQGDERDDIIITIGYGMNADGQMVYRFGPLNQQGGERRLNVAITRAREQVILVSSFGPEDLDDGRLHAEGARMLKRYITYAASGGAELGVVARPRQTLNPFENDILHQLGAAGVPVIPQLGVSGYSIDFAAVHPDDPARYVLAIEADGASYHSSATARDRDRLRQEHLERLGWRFHRIWSTEWFHHRDREVERAVAAWRAAVGERQHIPGNAPAALPPPLPGAAAAADPPRGPSTTTSVPGRSDPRPKIRRDEPITAYSDPELDAIVEWVRSDTLLRTDDELLALTVQELGYRRKGSRIVAAVEAAIERTRSSDAPTPAAPANGLTAPVVGSRPLTPPPTPGASGEGITGEV